METFLNLALQRRSIRRYQERPVEREKTDLILKAALSSPSSKHLNPWEFVVVTDRDTLSAMSACRTYGSSMLAGAPLGIVVCVDASLTDTWQCDGAIAALDMLLCAEDLGLGGCWVQVYGRAADSGLSAEQMIKDLLSIPRHLSVLCVVSIGYKEEEKKHINPDKLQYEKLHYGKY